MEFEKQKDGLSAPKLMNNGEITEPFKATGYTNPFLETGYQSLYYLCDRDPTSTELDVLDPANAGVGVYVNIPDFIYMWVNQVSKEIFWCSDNTFNAMVWHHMASNINIASILTAAGYPTGVWTQSFVSSPAFNTARSSSTNNMTVVASFSQSSTVLTAAIVNAQLNISGTWTTVSTASLSGLLTSQTNSITFDVPKNIQYRFVQASGSNTIGTVMETLK